MSLNHNTFDNQFLEDEFKPKQTDTILAQKVDSVLIQKFKTVLQIYHNNAFQNGYNAKLAFRVIALYLYTQVKVQFNVIDEVNRFINNQLKNASLSQIQKCMDMLMIKSLKLRVPQVKIKLWQIKLIVALKKYYKQAGLKKQKKKASLGLRQMCKQQLKKEDVKHDKQNYQQILDILLQEQYCLLNSKKARGKLFQAIQNGNNIIRALQKADQLLVSKYQQKLMIAYWQIARLHFHLHYITYARKYCQITMNISQRINNNKIYIASRAMMDSINTG